MDFDRLSQLLSPELRAAALLTALILVLGRIPILKFIILPFSIFGVIIHELAHALAMLLTGGKFLGLTFGFNPSTNEVSGLAAGKGGDGCLVTNAGYVGTIAFGALLLVIATSSVSARAVLLAMGIALIVITLFAIRGPFAILCALALGAAMVMISRQFPELIAKGVLWIAAVTLFVDSALHLIGTPSDSKILEKSTGINFGYWIVLWQVLAVIILLYALNRAYDLPLPWTLFGRAG